MKKQKKQRVKRVGTGKYHHGASGRYTEKEFALKNKELVMEETRVVEVKEDEHAEGKQSGAESD